MSPASTSSRSSSSAPPAARRNSGFQVRPGSGPSRSVRCLFPAGAFDVVFTSGALTQTEDKAGIVAECLRVLKPGGVLTCYDWLKSDAPISDDLRYFIKMEGLTYNLITLAELGRHLVEGGFEDVTMEDASDWYRRESRREYERMRGEGRPRVVELIGEAQADHMIEDWRSMVVVCDKGELRQGYTRGRKPL